ncbi:bactofilin family protein [Herbaspirillum seropedicae]|uniref:bactofilin family protein n=1 Tax=Herbaspirillum seropedicae TaxID=964 RepID=UPI002857139E|nr:polymer-forming cytoskeletal protein [Herbaspirillum seropedicae]MDR6398011.1 cytoskeletal protein CcmA (bactofilin family) [Herbaspirillum seropedicae]
MSGKTGFLTRILVLGGAVKMAEPKPVHIKSVTDASAPPVKRAATPPSTPVQAAPAGQLDPKQVMLPLKSNTESGGQVIHTILPQSTNLVGDLAIEESIVLEGTLRGNVKIIGQNQFVLGNCGAVHGDVNSAIAVIGGSIEGNLHVGDLTIKANGIVRGDIKYTTIAMEPGAAVFGQLQRIDPSVVGEIEQLVTAPSMVPAPNYEDGQGYPQQFQ